MPNLTRKDGQQDAVIRNFIELQQEDYKARKEEREVLIKTVATLQNDLKEIKDRLEDEDEVKEKWAKRFWYVILPAISAFIISFVLWFVEWIKAHIK